MTSNVAATSSNARLRSHPLFRTGMLEQAGVSPGMSAWGLVTGVAMVKSGLSVPVALAMSLTVFAGSAQLAALPLLASHSPMWVIWATAVCVNLRFVIFSAQWRPYLMRYPRAQRLFMGYFCADMNYVLFMKRFRDPNEDPRGQLAYFVGANVVNWPAWQVPSVIGILLAEAIPTHWGLGFAGVLALLGLLYSLLSDRATSAAAGVAAFAAVAAYAMPLHLNIVVAIAAALAMGLWLEHTGSGSRTRLFP